MGQRGHQISRKHVMDAGLAAYWTVYNSSPLLNSHKVKPFMYQTINYEQRFI